MAAWIVPATSTCGCPWRARTLVVDRVPGRAAYPRQSGPARLFALKPGGDRPVPGELPVHLHHLRLQSELVRYEDWLILIANGEMKADGFVSREPDHHVDHRVHLYGGSRQPRVRAVNGGGMPGSSRYRPAPATTRTAA